jgi:plasmid stabilization system protein ParE
MEIRVFWTETALNNLEDIFEYYKYKASIGVARRIVKEIVKSSLKLQKSPEIGRKEELLSERENEYRFLVVRNYKVIYWIDGKYIKIAAVFDSRQNPKKIQKL